MWSQRCLDTFISCCWLVFERWLTHFSVQTCYNQNSWDQRLCLMSVEHSSTDTEVTDIQILNEHWSDEYSNVKWTSEQQTFKCCINNRTSDVQVIFIIYK